MTCAPSEDSDQTGRMLSSLSAQWVAKYPSFFHVDSENSDQTGRMPTHICVFTGHTGHFVVLVMLRLILDTRFSVVKANKSAKTKFRKSNNKGTDEPAACGMDRLMCAFVVHILYSLLIQNLRHLMRKGSLASYRLRSFKRACSATQKD